MAISPFYKRNLSKGPRKEGDPKLKQSTLVNKLLPKTRENLVERVNRATTESLSVNQPIVKENKEEVKIRLKKEEEKREKEKEIKLNQEALKVRETINQSPSNYREYLNNPDVQKRLNQTSSTYVDATHGLDNMEINKNENIPLYLKNQAINKGLNSYITYGTQNMDGAIAQAYGTSRGRGDQHVVKINKDRVKETQQRYPGTAGAGQFSDNSILTHELGHNAISEKTPLIKDEMGNEQEYHHHLAAASQMKKMYSDFYKTQDKNLHIGNSIDKSGDYIAQSSELYGHLTGLKQSILDYSKNTNNTSLLDKMNKGTITKEDVKELKNKEIRFKQDEKFNDELVSNWLNKIVNKSSKSSIFKNKNIT